MKKTISLNNLLHQSNGKQNSKSSRPNKTRQDIKRGSKFIGGGFSHNYKLNLTNKQLDYK